MTTLAKKMFWLTGTVALTASLSMAQEVPNIKAYVPFDFQVGSQTLPAGTYTIKADASSSIMTVQSKDSRQTSMILTQQGLAKVDREKSHLMFHVVGDKKYLAEVWCAETGGGRSLPKTKNERKAELETRAATNPSNVVIMASLAN